MTATNRCMVGWFAWPFVAVWQLLGFMVVVLLRFFAAILGVGLMVLGIGLTMTVAAAPIGIPFAILGLLLLLRSVF